MEKASELLKRARQRLGVSQVRLAVASGVSRGLINRYERGHVEPTVEQLNRLLGPLDRELTTQRILTREETRSLNRATSAAELLLADPSGVSETARRQLTIQMENMTVTERGWLDVWKAVLELPAPIVADLLTDASEFARALRQSSPLSAVLSSEVNRDAPASA